MISESKYPPLLWSSYRPNFTPENLDIECVDGKGLAYLQNSKSFQNWMSLLGFDYYQGHNLQTRMRKEVSLPSYQPHKNLFLKEDLFRKIDSDQAFRNKIFLANTLIPSSSGTILFKNNGCYMYRILSPEDSQVYKKGNFTECEIPDGSRYYAIAFFIQGLLLGFEEGISLPNSHISVNKNGYYQPNQEVGQFISFVTISLKAFYSNAVPSKFLKPKEGLNQTSQSLHILG